MAFSPKKACFVIFGLCFLASLCEREGRSCGSDSDCPQHEGEANDMEVSLLQSKSVKKDLAQTKVVTSSESAHVQNTSRVSDEVASNASGGGVCSGGSMCDYADQGSCVNSIFGCSWINSCSGYCSGGSMCNYGSQSDCINNIFGCTWNCNPTPPPTWPDSRRRSESPDSRRRWGPSRRRRSPTRRRRSNSNGVCAGGNTCKDYSTISSCVNSIFDCRWEEKCDGYCSGGSMCNYGSQSDCINNIFGCTWNCNPTPTPTWYDSRRRSGPTMGYTESPLQQDEGQTVGSGNGATSLADCEWACNSNSACKSFSYTPDFGGSCWLKDKCVKPWDPTKVNGNFKTYYKPCPDGNDCPGTANCWDVACANSMFDRRRRDGNMASCRRRDGASSTGKYMCCGNQMRYYT